MSSFIGIKLVLAKFKSMPLDAFVKKALRKSFRSTISRCEAIHDVIRDTRSLTGARVDCSYICVGKLETDNLDLKV